MQTNDRQKGKLGSKTHSRNLVATGSRKPWLQQLRLEMITVQFNFFSERFLYDSPLLVVEQFLIRPPVGAISRFRCNTEGAVERNVELCEYFTQLQRQVFIANDSVDDDFVPRTIRVPEIVNGKSPASEILVERKPAAFANRVHVVMRQNLVPWISFHAKFEVAVPDLRVNSLLHLARRHVIIKLCVTRHCVAQRGEKLAWSFEDFGNRINESFVIARLMSFDRRHNRRDDVLRAAMFRQKDFDACAGGLRRLDENELVFVGQDH